MDDEVEELYEEIVCLKATAAHAEDRLGRAQAALAERDSRIEQLELDLGRARADMASMQKVAAANNSARLQMAADVQEADDALRHQESHSEQLVQLAQHERDTAQTLQQMTIQQELKAHQQTENELKAQVACLREDLRDKTAKMESAALAHQADIAGAREASELLASQKDELEAALLEGAARSQQADATHSEASASLDELAALRNEVAQLKLRERRRVSLLKSDDKVSVTALLKGKSVAVWIYYEELVEGIEPIRCCWDASCNLEEAIQSITTRAGWGDRGPRVWSIYDVHGVVLYPTAVASCEAVVHFAFEDNQVVVVSPRPPCRQKSAALAHMSGADAESDAATTMSRYYITRDRR